MDLNINAVIRRWKETRSEADFKTIYDHVFPDFKYWYRHVQRFTDLDRPTLLCEFQYIVLKSLIGYHGDNPVPDGFVRYLRAALSKHAYTLRRVQRATIKCHSMQQDWEVVDPKSLTGIEQLEIMDIVNACFMEDERMIVLSKMTGEGTESIKKRSSLSEFQFRQAIRNIKSNRRLQKTLSR